MGLLDSKSRVMDTLLTQEGRRHLINGKLQLSYVSFTDGSTFYKSDLVSGSADATTRVYFEANSLPSDQVAFRGDDEGRVQSFSGQFAELINDGRIVSFSETADKVLLTGSSRLLYGDEFLDVAGDVLAESAENFKRMYLIGTKDVLFEDDGFDLGPDSIRFVTTDSGPIIDPTRRITNVNNLDSIFNDLRFSAVGNFSYLPPLNKKRSMTDEVQLGYYPPWGPTRHLQFSDLMHELSFFERLGCSRVVSFDPTSRDNRLMAQFFEMHGNMMRKLDVYDFGTYSDSNHTNAHVFFVGRLVVDDRGSQTFIHLFTLMFE